MPSYWYHVMAVVLAGFVTLSLFLNKDRPDLAPGFRWPFLAVFVLGLLSLWAS